MDDIEPVELQEPLDELARDPTRFAHDLKFPPPDKIRIYDDTLRDGEQMPGVAITPKDKYQLARQLSDIWVHVMDVGFPSVSEGERETLRLVLGSQALDTTLATLRRRIADLETQTETAASTDHND